METVKFNGLTIGNPDSPVRLIGVSGLDDYDSNADVHAPDWLHGGWPTGGYMPRREVTLDIRVDGRYGNVRAATQAIKRAFRPATGGINETALEWTDMNGTTQVLYCRCIARSLPMTNDFRHRVEGSIRLLAADPRLYSVNELATSIGAWATSGGTNWAGLTWPFSWQPDATAETAAYNNGTFNTWPRFVITGPSSGALTNPRIENLADGTSIDLSADGGLTINAGQSLEIVTAPQSRNVTLEGVARWNNLKEGSRFTPLEPGDTSFRLRANGDTAGAQLTIYWRHAEL